jgi:DNA-binding transcriptional regulator YiaG
MDLSLVDEAKLSKQLPAPDEARRIRIATGISVVRLARELDVHPNTVARWEAGTRHPRGGARLRYAHLLAALAAAVPTE